MEQKTKVCTQCKADKPVGEFNKCSSTKDGLQYKCKTCKHAAYEAAGGAARTNAKYHANPEPCRARSRVYNAAHKEDVARRGREWSSKNREYRNARANARNAQKSLERQRQKLAAQTQTAAELRATTGIRKWESAGIQ